MTSAPVPERPKVYHITHLENLASIIEKGELVSDALRIQQDINCSQVGMPSLKQRRLTEIEVPCCPGTLLGQYVPFYFCPRSVMLYILHMGNHPDITYSGGQGPILHLEADLFKVIEWANQKQRAWAFTDRHAALALASFFNQPRDLERLNWHAIASRDFRDPSIKDSKQAEFLLFETFPWDLVETIGTSNETMRGKVQAHLPQEAQVPNVVTKASWYY